MSEKQRMLRIGFTEKAEERVLDNLEEDEKEWMNVGKMFHPNWALNYIFTEVNETFKSVNVDWDEDLTRSMLNNYFLARLCDMAELEEMRSISVELEGEEEEEE